MIDTLPMRWIKTDPHSNNNKTNDKKKEKTKNENENTTAHNKLIGKIPSPPGP